MPDTTPTERPGDLDAGPRDRLTTGSALVAGGLTTAIAAYQVALAAGALFGQDAWGGRIDDDVLSPALRVGSVVAAVILVWMSGVILARADLIGINPVPRRWLGRTTWIIAAYMVLNTIGNLSSPSDVERFVLGPATIVIAICAAIVAHRGPRS